MDESPAKRLCYRVSKLLRNHLYAFRVPFFGGFNFNDDPVESTTLFSKVICIAVKRAIGGPLRFSLAE